MDMQTFWQHSLSTGLISRLLGARCGVAEPEALFIAGLLHDVGQLIILAKLPEMGRETRLRARDCGLPLHALEQAVIGFDHAAVGAELLRQWRLPEAICEAVACHHQPAGATRAPLASAIVHVADILAHEFMAGTGVPDEVLLAETALRADPSVLDVIPLEADLVLGLAATFLGQRDALREILL